MSEEKKLEIVTSEEYHEIRRTIEEGITDYADKVLFKGVCQDEVASLIEDVGGIVTYYKREDDKEVVYDYCIGLSIDRSDYK